MMQRTNFHRNAPSLEASLSWLERRLQAGQVLSRDSSTMERTARLSSPFTLALLSGPEGW